MQKCTKCWMRKSSSLIKTDYILYLVLVILRSYFRIFPEWEESCRVRLSVLPPVARSGAEASVGRARRDQRDSGGATWPRWCAACHVSPGLAIPGISGHGKAQRCTRRLLIQRKDCQLDRKSACSLLYVNSYIDVKLSKHCIVNAHF